MVMYLIYPMYAIDVLNLNHKTKINHMLMSKASYGQNMIIM
jgi:hypothetical protein